MGILDKISDDHDQRLMKDTVERLEEERLAQSQALALGSIIGDVFNKLATALEEDMEVITSGTFYRVGDLVFCVGLFQKKEGLPDPTNPKLAVMEYVVWLLGVNQRTTQLDRVRVGTLKFLNYDGLYETVTKASANISFSADEVLKLREQFNIYG